MTDNLELEVVEPSEDDARMVALQMRELDVQEIRAASNVEPLEMLLGMLEVPNAATWTLLSDEGPVAMGGLVPSLVLPDWAVVWMVGTDWITRNHVRFTKLMRHKMTLALQEYEGLYNWVDTRNLPARRWLEAMGFRIERPEPFGAHQLDFHYFWIKSPPEEEE